MQRNPVGWFEIYVPDLDLVQKFYETVLGVELTKLDSPSPDVEMRAFPMPGGDLGGGIGPHWPK